MLQNDMDAVLYLILIVYFIAGFCALVQLSSFLIRKALTALRWRARRNKRLAFRKWHKLIKGGEIMKILVGLLLLGLYIGSWHIYWKDIFSK